MKKIIITALAVIMALSLFSCADDDGAPNGMKLASDRARVDYSLYIPDEWVIDEKSTFCRAHAQSETASVSVFDFICQPDITIDEWWNDIYAPQIAPTLKEYAFIDSVDGIVVNKSAATAYVFTSARDEGASYKHRVTITKNGAKMYVIWYTALVTKDTDYYLESISAYNDIVNTFKISEIVGTSALAPFEDENTPEGMMLISNPNIVLYSLYVPRTWIIDDQSAMTMAHVSSEDKSSVSVMQWNITRDLTTIDGWWNDFHKKEMSATFGERFKVTSEGTEASLGQREAKAYEYEIALNGMTYQFYVVAAMDQGSIHVFTYTSVFGKYEQGLSIVKEQILPNFKFN